MLERALVVTGTVGVGKTTVAEKVADLLADAGQPHAWIDLDALSAAWPRPSDDPFNNRLTAHNLACVATNMAAAGARSLVLAGVVQTPDVLDLYENAIGVAITVVRLKSPPEVVDARLRRRYGDTDPESLKWHLDRAPELEAILDSSPVATRIVPNISSPIEVARSVLAVWTATGDAP
jgi:predicted ABC-type ATPase